MIKLRQLLFLLLLTALAACTCNSKKENKDTAYKLNQPLTVLASYDEGYPLTDEVIDEKAPYEDKDYKAYFTDFYKDKIAPPPFDYNVDLSKKSFQELRVLRSEILARHGYLFMDYVLRSHFNATKWYQPVFWYNDFKIKLSEEEKKFIDKVLKQETELYKNNYIVSNGTKSANTANVVNWQQFDKVPDVMMQHLEKDGFVINKSHYEQLFHVYDENYYSYVPSFITPDLLLQVMHMHISKEMQAIEEEKMVPLLTTLLQEQLAYVVKTGNSGNPDVKEAAKWCEVYYAVGLSLITGDKKEVSLKSDYEYEFDHTTSGQDRKSDFLGDSLFDYTQFQPRGNYTRNDTLKRYFKCVKWLNSAPIYMDTDEGLRRGILMTKALNEAEGSISKYKTYSGIIDFLAGEENNLSFVHLSKVMSNYPKGALEVLFTEQNLGKIRKELSFIDPKKMVAVGANKLTQDFLDRKKILFTAGRYTFDADILQRLVDIKRENLKLQPNRPFPKGLDIFATMGNKTAEDILLNTYKENQTWKNYSDTLNVLKKKFQSFNNWNSSVYNKTMETVLTLQTPDEKAPYFMQKPNWQRKNLTTMLASWTGLKHDMLLYIEQPNAAEMGDGGEVPPPQKIAYVEPQLAFWKKCSDFLELNKKMLNDNGLLTPKLTDRNDELQALAMLFYRISKKELNGEKLTSSEFDTLSFVGGQIERLTLNILESTYAETESVNTPDRYMAIAADVYTYKDKCLEETVGMGDEIYVIAEINGLLYLTRGAVFSHYEFTQPTSSRLTDEDWQKQLLDHKEPEPAIWMKEIQINIGELKTTPNFNLY
jgi:hypothetical protein